MSLTGDDVATECHQVNTHLFAQILDVDPETAILPIEIASTLASVCTVSQLPGNWTKLGQFII